MYLSLVTFHQQMSMLTIFRGTL